MTKFEWRIKPNDGMTKDQKGAVADAAAVSGIQSFVIRI
jgi:hypothetical protein